MVGRVTQPLVRALRGEQIRLFGIDARESAQTCRADGQPEVSSPGRHAVVRETQEVECLRLARPALASVQNREPAKLHETGLVRVKAEAESGQPLSDVAEVPLRIPLILEPDNDIVSVTNDDRFAIRDIRAPSLMEPQVEHVMQEHIRQHGRNHSLNAKGNFIFERRIGGWRGCTVLDLRLKK